jgi:hypothetical protein
MRKSILLLAGAAALALSLTFQQPARADYGWHVTHVDYFDDEGDWVEFWEDGEGRRLIFVIEDGETIAFIADGFDNPNPVDGSGSNEDMDHLIDLAKKRGAKLERITNLAGTPLGHQLLRGGHLIDPVHNPSDVGYEDGGGFGGGSGGGFTPGNGSPTEQLKKNARKGNKSTGDGEDGDDINPTEVGLFDDNMPGPPELVNPNPQMYIKKHDAGRDGAGGNGAGGNGGGGGGNSAATR